MRHGLLQQLLRFGVAGVLGFVVDVAVLYALEPLMGWYLARVLSFWAAASATWWFNRRFTFAATPGPSDAVQVQSVLRQYLHYLATMLIGGAVNYAVYAAVLQATSMRGAALLGVALGSCVGLVFNFASARYLVFKAR